MIERHFEGLLNYFVHRLTNALCEGFNSKIQQLKSAARGFRSFWNYRTRILFFLGKLDLSVSHAPATKSGEEPTFEQCDRIIRYARNDA